MLASKPSKPLPPLRRSDNPNKNKKPAKPWTKGGKGGKKTQAGVKRPFPGSEAEGSDVKLSKKQAKKETQTKRRKVERSHGELVEKCNKLWNVARDSVHNDRDKRKAAVSEIVGHIKGKALELARKHDGSRFVQQCVAEGSTEEKQSIFEELKGHFVELSKCKYGHHLAKKFIDNNNYRLLVLPEFFGHVKKLLRKKIPGGILDTLYNLINKANRARLIEELYDPKLAVFKSRTVQTTNGKTGGATPNTNMDTDTNPEINSLASVFAAKDTATFSQDVTKLQEYIMKLLEKGRITSVIVQHLLVELFEFNKYYATAELQDAIRDGAPHMVHSADGLKLALFCLNLSTAAQRKKLIKGLKGFVANICQDKIAWPYIARIIAVVDDTRLVNTAICSELQVAMRAIVTDAAGQLFLRSLLAPASDPGFGAGKKDAAVRRSETVGQLFPYIVRASAAAASELLKTPSGMLLLHECFTCDFIASFDEGPALFRTVGEACLENNAAILCDFHVSRGLKRLIGANVSGVGGQSFAQVFAVLLGERKMANELATTPHVSWLVVKLLETPSSAPQMRTLLTGGGGAAPLRAQAGVGDKGTQTVLALLSGKHTKSRQQKPAKTTPPATTRAAARRREREEQTGTTASAAKRPSKRIRSQPNSSE